MTFVLAFLSSVVLLIFIVAEICLTYISFVARSYVLNWNRRDILLTLGLWFWNCVKDNFLISHFNQVLLCWNLLWRISALHVDLLQHDQRVSVKRLGQLCRLPSKAFNTSFRLTLFSEHIRASDPSFTFILCEISNIFQVA